MSSSVALITMILLGFSTMLLMLCSSYIKISVVLLILRNALGLQQAPANSIVFSLAVLLSIFVAAPLITEIVAVLGAQASELSTISDLGFVMNDLSVPLEGFLRANTDAPSLAMVQESALQLWGKEEIEGPFENFITVLTAFTLSELKKAFFIGFMIYLPFLVIDLVITTILLALGMMMVSPPMISVPFKLLLFVSIEGWTRLFSNFILSYQYA